MLITLIYSLESVLVLLLISAIVSPMWAKMSDKHGRKPMLLRASIGMAIVIFWWDFPKMYMS